MSSSSHVLLVGSNSVQSLVSSSLISQLESLLDSHRLEDAFNLADAQRKKLEGSLEVDEDEVCAVLVLFTLIILKIYRQRSSTTCTSGLDSNTSPKPFSKTQETTSSMGI
jgi:hypothetical protein